MRITFTGKILIICFIIFMLKMMIDGPFIFSRGNKYVIKIKDFKFDQTYLKIKKGDKIVFRNEDQIRYNVINDHDLIPNSKILLNKDRYEHIFNHDFDKVIFNTSLYENVEPLVVERDNSFDKKSFFQQMIENIRELFGSFNLNSIKIF